MVDWNPALYRCSRTSARARPPNCWRGFRCPQRDAPVDLGCGPGNSTELWSGAFPDAEVLGIDNSEAMLAAARERLPLPASKPATSRRWTPAAGRPDLIYANAALQWVPDHETLIPRLFAALAPGGVLAVQMPDNRAEPTHRLMREVAAERAVARAPSATPPAAHRAAAAGRLLRPAAAQAARSTSGTPSTSTRWPRPRRSSNGCAPPGSSPSSTALRRRRARSYLAEYEARIARGLPARAPTAGGCSRSPASSSWRERHDRIDESDPPPARDALLGAQAGAVDCRCATTTAASRRACARASRCRPR